MWLRAERQLGGKGRRGRSWSSPPGNLYASTLVRLQPGDPPAPTLALTAAVALHEAAQAVAPAERLLLKWPNDLLARVPAQAGTQDERSTGLLLAQGHTQTGAKLAGILLEREGDAIVIGFGVNLAHHPQDIARPVTSVAALTDVAPTPETFAEQLAGSFRQWLARWRSEGLAPVRIAWLERAHPVGAALTADTEHGKIEGLFDGLDQSGALRLRLADGSVRVIHAGDVFLI